MAARVPNNGADALVCVRLHVCAQIGMHTCTVCAPFKLHDTFYARCYQTETHRWHQKQRS